MCHPCETEDGLWVSCNTTTGIVVGRPDVCIMSQIIPLLSLSSINSVLLSRPSIRPTKGAKSEGKISMVLVYYHDNIESDPRFPHIGEAASMSALEELGIVANHYENIAGVNELAEERGYKNRDEVRWIYDCQSLTRVYIIQGHTWSDL